MPEQSRKKEGGTTANFQISSFACLDSGNYEMRYCRNFGGGLLGGVLRFATVANRRKPDRVAPLCYFRATREAAKPHLLDLRNFGGASWASWGPLGGTTGEKMTPNRSISRYGSIGRHV